MTSRLPAITPAPAMRLAAQFDAFHTARDRSTLVARLYATAMGDGYPHEVAASSSCDRPLLGLLAARLRLRPGQVLADAGCGTGGAGLWLARALAARLEGFDVSPVAVAQATARSSRFVPAGRAPFRVTSLDDIGLPDRSVHGAVCVDAFALAANRAAAVRDLGRALAPGVRLILTSQMVKAATVTPRTRDSPWMRRYPRWKFSRTSRSTGSRTEYTVRGLPGARAGKAAQRGDVRPDRDADAARCPDAPPAVSCVAPARAGGAAMPPGTCDRSGRTEPSRHRVGTPAPWSDAGGQGSPCPYPGRSPAAGAAARPVIMPG